MAYPLNVSVNTGNFVPTTNVWDPSDIDVSSENFKQLIVRLHQNINQIALVLNTKVTGYQVDTEFLTGGLFTNPGNPGQLRPIFRKVINMGQLAPGATLTIPHGLTMTATFLFISPLSGVASKTTAAYAYIPIPYLDLAALTHCAMLSVTATDVIITAGANLPATYDTCYVTLEYVK